MVALFFCAGCVVGATLTSEPSPWSGSCALPSLNQTGSHANSGHIIKAGSLELRWLMVESARSAVRFDPHWQRVETTANQGQNFTGNLAIIYRRANSC